MTDDVAIAAIHAIEIIIPSAISAWAVVAAQTAAKNSAAAKTAIDATHAKLEVVAKNVDGLTEAAIKSAGDLGHAVGKAEGVEQERKANSDH